MKSKKAIPVFLFVWTVFFHLSSSAQEIQGKWHGMLKISNFNLRIDLEVTEKDGQYKATFFSLDQVERPGPIDEFSYSDGKVNFFIQQAGIKYSGTLDKVSATIRGMLKQNDQSIPLDFSRQFIEAPKGSVSWQKTFLNKREVYITMRDGTRLFTSIYSPRDTTQLYPILCCRTPYNIEPRGPLGYASLLATLADYIEEGYIFVFQDVRGRQMSEGVFVDTRPIIPDKKTNKDIDESTDTFDTIDWLIKNVAHNNGRVGIFGLSYDGFYATMSLMDAHPALKAVSPQAPVTNWFIGDDFHHNGAFAFLDAFSFMSFFGKPRPKPTRTFATPYNFPNQDNYNFFLGIGTIKNARKQALGDSIEFWNQIMEHPDYDAFWKSRDPRQYLKDIKPAVLTVGGLFDAEDCWGAWHTYEAIEKQNPASISNNIMMGPWAHGQWRSPFGEKLGNIQFGANTITHFREGELKFFNYYLKGKGSNNFPEADIFVTGENQWRSFDNWPPKNVTEKTFYLQPGGKLALEVPVAKKSFGEYVSDPMKPVPYTEDVHMNRTREYMTDDQRFASRRPDVMVYQTEPLAENTTVVGPFNADLFVSTSGTDADFVVKLIDVFPDSLRNYAVNDKHVPMQGYQMLVRGEIFRGRYRNSYEKPEAFVPGKVTEVKYELPGIAHTFLKGHRIMVQVQNSWFPLFDRNPQQMVDIYQCSEKDFKKATMRIYHETRYPSGVKLLILGK